MSELAVDIQDVWKKFRLYHERNQSLKSAFMRRRTSTHEDFWALQGISLEIKQGTTHGLIGRNGSGKSTLLKCLAKIYWPTSGDIRYHGSMASLLEVGSGFHLELSGRENIYLNGSILGMSKKAIDKKFDEIVDFSGIERFLDQPVKNYSSGMYVRLGFSIAINVEPDILVVDEVLSVGDAEFQEKSIKKFADFKKQGRTIVVVSHSMALMDELCDRITWIDSGKVIATGRSSGVIEKYLKAQHHD